MRHYAFLRLLLAAFFMYFAWPLIPQATSQLEMLFWGAWLAFFVLVFGANFATLLKMSEPPVMEQEYAKVRQTDG
ncbi:hypothetical protein [Paucisalibacillus globulus]|uniref:hypothetical protein n=1 Tax=Paucisalibacillus globulus TaxID=351095 RepID=UPI000BB68CD1|nr:hypothetical protein [Paucisalibacillus globulus]